MSIMNETYYVMKDGHCLAKFDDSDSALSYARLVGGKIYDNKK